MSESRSDGQAIETMQIEVRRYPPDPEFSRQANAQPDIYERGFDEFWTNEAERISWFEPWKQLYEWNSPSSPSMTARKRMWSTERSSRA